MNQPAGRQVLVVDDEAGMRTALEASFSRRGWQVETAVGAADAMTRFRRRPSDLVVTDMRMSDGDGFSVIRQVQEFAPHTAVILLTAFGSVPDAVEAMQSGACDYLVKPVAFEQLEKVAEKILRRAQLSHPRHRETRDLRLPSLRSTATSGGNPFIGHSSSLAAALDRARIERQHALDPASGPIHNGARGACSLPVGHRGLGEHPDANLPLYGNPLLRPHPQGRIYVRG